MSSLVIENLPPKFTRNFTANDYPHDLCFSITEAMAKRLQDGAALEITLGAGAGGMGITVVVKSEV